MVKVSVVIPVYNVEDYLGECLDSVVNQTLKDIEIICINDGSTDKSLDILNEYASKDSRITVIDQENGGHAVATNRGMKLAKGEYLYLMDSDDIVDVHALEETVKIADERKVDFVIFQAINYYMDTDEYKEQENYSMNELADFVGDSVFNWKDIKDYIFSITVTPWSKIYRRDFVEKNNCQFPEGLVFDDNIFFWEVLFSADRITFYRKHLFTRRWHSASSTMAGNRNTMDSIEIFELLWKTFERFGAFDDYKDELYNKRVEVTYWRLKQIKDELKQEFFDKFKASLSEIDNADFKDYLTDKNLKIYETLMYVTTPEELILTVQNYTLNLKKRKLTLQNDNLTKKIEKRKKLYKKVARPKESKIKRTYKAFKRLI